MKTEEDYMLLQKSRGKERLKTTLLLYHDFSEAG